VTRGRELPGVERSQRTPQERRRRSSGFERLYATSPAEGEKLRSETRVTSGSWS